MVKKRLLLYIEDVADNIVLLKAVLRRRPHVRLLPALWGKEGIELATRYQPDLILLDLHLPDMEGEEVLRALRSSDKTAKIPVVVITADVTRERRKSAIAHRPDDFLTKPLAIADLLASIDRYLS